MTNPFAGGPHYCIIVLSPKGYESASRRRGQFAEAAHRVHCVNVISCENPQEGLTDGQVRDVVAASVEAMGPDGRSVLVIIPDPTRTCPLPEIARELHARLRPRVRRVDFLVALGTHPALSEDQLDRLLGVERGRRADVLPGSRVFNHEWNNPAALTRVGVLSAEEIDRITGGLFALDIDVTINKLIFNYDILLICGPVFPHEVVGMSGGAKYLFPGICGPKLLNFFHWLGAVITNPRIIGRKHTPVRDVLHAAADMVTMPKHALCMVVDGEGLAGLYFGEVKEAWSAAADLSDRIHITYVDGPFHSVLSQAPEMYGELWVGGKCMYKLEPVVADGGELIIYAPHIRQLSAAHGRIIEEIGYHTRDYFLKQWGRFRDYPWGVLAHSTHVRGIGTYENGVEAPRIQVTLATGIPEDLCRRIHLGYRDPDSIDASQWQGREDEGRLYVPKAGEMLYRLKSPPEWQRIEQGGNRGA
jgi:nickel-dependent lactate racemase